MLENVKACFMYGKFLIRRRKKIKDICKTKIDEINNTFGMGYDSYINVKYYKRISRYMDKSYIYPDEFFANAIWLFGNYGDVLYNIDIGVHGKEISNEDMNKLMKNYHRYNESKELHRERNGYLQFQIYMNSYNLFQCVSKNTQIVKFYHTDATNGFILKNQDKKDSAINLDEFRNGILLGYIDRQVEGNKIYSKDEINGKNKRWKNKGQIDIQCMKINNYIQKKYRNNKVERPGMADNQLALPSSRPCKMKGKKMKVRNMKLLNKKRKGLKVKKKFSKNKKGIVRTIKNKAKSFGKRLKTKLMKKKKYQKKGKYNKKKKEGIIKRGIKTIGRGLKQVGKGMQKGLKRLFH